MVPDEDHNKDVGTNNEEMGTNSSILNTAKRVQFSSNAQQWTGDGSLFLRPMTENSCGSETFTDEEILKELKEWKLRAIAISLFSIPFCCLVCTVPAVIMAHNPGQSVDYYKYAVRFSLYGIVSSIIIVLLFIAKNLLSLMI